MKEPELRAFERAFEDAKTLGSRDVYVSADRPGEEITIDGVFDLDQLLEGLKRVLEQAPGSPVGLDDWRAR